MKSILKKVIEIAIKTTISSLYVIACHLSVEFFNIENIYAISVLFMGCGIKVLGVFKWKYTIRLGKKEVTNNL